MKGNGITPNDVRRIVGNCLPGDVERCALEGSVARACGVVWGTRMDASRCAVVQEGNTITVKGRLEAMREGYWRGGRFLGGKPPSYTSDGMLVPEMLRALEAKDREDGQPQALRSFAVVCTDNGRLCVSVDGVFASVGEWPECLCSAVVCAMAARGMLTWFKEEH